MMGKLISSTLGFVISYLILMAPTYLLPYLGSNSALVNGIGAIMGRGPTPQWWMHFWCLFMLILVAYVRGKWIGKSFLPALPILALAFDLTPVLSSIPFIPTIMHVLVLILGAMGEASAAAKETPPKLKRPAWTAGGVTALALLGMVWFNVQTAKTAPKMLRPSTAPAKASPPPSAPQAEVKPTPVAPAASPPTQAHPPKPATKSAEKGVSKGTESKKPATEKPTVRMINVND